MPIVFVHGVANRISPEYERRNAEVQALLERYVCPEIAEGCRVSFAYWGDKGITFAYGGAARPRSALLGHGPQPAAPAEKRLVELASVRTDLPQAANRQPSGLISKGVAQSSSSVIRLKDLAPDDLADFLAALINTETPLVPERATMLIAADEVAHDIDTFPQLSQCDTSADELQLLRGLLIRRFRSALVEQGGASAWDRLVDHAREVASRAEDSPGFAVSTLLAELRPAINDAVTLFVGDVFAYLSRRVSPTDPGDIPNCVIKQLQAAHESAPTEPLVVLTHSMGGQLVYDLVTYFLPRMRSNLRVDFWCATASQVGLFEEMKLFMTDDAKYCKANGTKVPFPDRRYLGYWWNVWDHNDFISYTAGPIFEGVDDEEFNSGVSLLQGHGAYFTRPSFYRRLAAKIRIAKQSNWGRI